MLSKFHNKKSTWWLIGMAVLIVGFLTFAVVVPNASEPTVTEPVNVPAMQNVPPSQAPNMQLEVESH